MISVIIKNMKALKKSISSILVLAVLSACLFLTSCSGIMGYSVVLWNVPEQKLADGTIVPVYIKSNVSHVYVIKLPDSKEKLEVPLWKISEPASKSKAKKIAAKYKSYEHTYARCVLDGLPIRADKVNTSKQVYRLRKDEVVRALYEAEGQAVRTGKNSSMDGKWLRVISKDGTLGWCFSYNLRLFKMNADGTVQGGDAESTTAVETDAVMEKMLETKWYPESYSAMIKSGNIDLINMQPSFGFDTGYESEKVILHLTDINEEYPFTGVTKTDRNVYKFDDTPFQVTVRSDTYIVVQYTAEDGKPKSYNFVSLEADVDQLISDETQRRTEAYTALRVLGPDFKSSNYGTLTFEESNSFSWRGYNLLVPSIVSKDAKGEGKILIQYFLSNQLKKDWDGVLTFNFDGMNSEVNFLYKCEKNGLRLEDATHAEMKGSTIVSRASNSLVMFFAN